MFPSAKPTTLAQVGRASLAPSSSNSADPISRTGAGLGVSISDAITRRMHGTLHYASELGSGTTASISLPLQLITSTPSRPKRPARILSEELSALFRPLVISEQAADLDNLRKKISTPRPVELHTPSPSAESAPLPNGRAGEDEVFRVLIADDNPIAR
jgi:hypothetical protein